MFVSSFRRSWRVSCSRCSPRWIRLIESIGSGRSSGLAMPLYRTTTWAPGFRCPVLTAFNRARLIRSRVGTGSGSRLMTSRSGFSLSLSVSSSFSAAMRTRHPFRWAYTSFQSMSVSVRSRTASAGRDRTMSRAESSNEMVCLARAMSRAGVWRWYQRSLEWFREWGRRQGSGVRGQGSGVRGQGSGVRGQGSGVRGQGSGVRGQQRHRAVC